MNKVLAFLLGVWIITSCSSSSDQASEKATRQTVADSVYRPAYHFSPAKNWIGAPISMVFHNNEYHLFYQYNSEDTDAESDRWGHAISPDMLKWEEVQPISELGDYEQGSIISDAANTSRLGQNLLVAITSEDNELNLSYSQDHGVSWSEYDNNPILEFSGRPKVIWIKETNQWIMTVTNETDVVFFSSEDLLHWSQESELSLTTSALSASLFPLSDKWGLLLNQHQGVAVMTGDFDGSTFTASSQPVPFDLGLDNKAGIVLTSQDRSIYIGQMSNPSYAEDLPTKGWKSLMTLPRELSLNMNQQVTGFPTTEINSILTAKRRGKLDLLKSSSANWYSFVASSMSDAIQVSILNEEGERITLDYNQSSFTLDRSASGLTDFASSFEESVTYEYENLSDTVKFDIFIDRSSIEMFINDGQLQFSSLVFPQNPYKSLELVVDGVKTNIPATIYDFDKVMF